MISKEKRKNFNVLKLKSPLWLLPTRLLKLSKVAIKKAIDKVGNKLNIPKILHRLQVKFLILEIQKYDILFLEIHMENQVNVSDQNNQQIGQNPVSQPIQLMEKPKVNYWMVTTFVLLIILVAGGTYTFNRATKLSNSQNANQIPPTTFPSPTTNTEPTPTATVTTSPTNNVVWKTQIIPIQHESAFLGSKTVNLEMKIPTDWTIQTSQVTTDPANNTIKNCSISTITSKDQSMKATFAPICTGWSAQYSAWPGDAVIALQQKRGGNDGLHNFYRVRVTSSVNNYNYVDAMTEPDRSLDKNKDQVIDALLIGYAPPNESKDDFFFIAAHLTANYSGQTSARDNFLSVVDQIAASITLK